MYLKHCFWFLDFYFISKYIALYNRMDVDK